jgi:hypothetical protein
VAAVAPQPNDGVEVLPVGRSSRKESHQGFLQPLWQGLRRGLQQGFWQRCWFALVTVGVSAYQVLPPLRQLSRVVPTASGSVADPLFNLWAVRTSLGNLRNNPGRLLQANIFWPRRDALAFSDSLLGYAPIYGFFSALTGRNHVLAYNITLLLMYVLGTFMVYLFCKFFGCSRIVSLIGALIFTTLPYRSAEVVHLQLTGVWIVLGSIYFLLRWFESRRARWIVLSSLFIAWAWYVSAYLVILGAVSAVTIGLVWLVRRNARAKVTVNDIGAVVLAAVLAGVAVSPTFSTYANIQKGRWLDRPLEQLIRIRVFGVVPSTLYRSADLASGFPAGPDALLPSPLLILVVLMTMVMGIVVARRVGVRSTNSGGGVALSERQPIEREPIEREPIEREPFERERIAPIEPVADVGRRRRQQFAVPIACAVVVSVLFTVGPGHGFLSWFFLQLRGIAGLRSIRDTSRFAIVPFAFGCVALAVAFEYLRTSAAKRLWLAVGSIACVVPIEASYRPSYTPARWETSSYSANEFLSRSRRGVVIELPMPTDTSQLENATGVRQLRSLHDGLPRALGLSGGLPPEVTFPFHAARAFPNEEALAQLRVLRVSYLILHGSDGRVDCADEYSPAELRELTRLLRRSPNVAEVTKTGRSVVVELLTDPPAGVDASIQLPPTKREGATCSAPVLGEIS